MDTAQLDAPVYTPERLALNTTTIDRRLTRKRSTEDVLVTAVGRRDGLLLAAGTLPRTHRYLNDLAGGRGDAVHLAAMLVQAVEVVAGALLDVAPHQHLVLRTIRIEVTDAPAAAAGEHFVVVLPERQVRRNADGAVYAVAGPVAVHVDGRAVARGDVRIGFLAPGTYDALRIEQGWTGLTAPAGRVGPVPPETVGRRFPGNVLVGNVGGPAHAAQGTLVPAVHPTFFDRPLDHYPGLMIGEAARQLATRSLAESAGVQADAVRTLGATLRFDRFVELDVPPMLRIAACRPGGEIAVDVCQGARTVSRFAYRMTAQQPDGSLS